MRYLVKIYIGTHFANDKGTNVSVRVTAENEEQAVERALSILLVGGMDYELYEVWEIE